MKQVVIKNKKLIVDDVPAPTVDDDSLLIEVAYSLISTGTELSGIRSAERKLVRRIYERPQKVIRAMQFLKHHGIKRTVEVTKGIGTSVPLGYSCSGTIIDMGKRVTGFKVGDRVACAGAGKATHAEIALVPKNLTVKIPKGCALNDAASVAVGAIALQGVRRADPRLGEVVAVLGLGLLGQITVQLLKTAGCRVLGFDVEKRRVDIAKKCGADYGYVISAVNYLEKALNITEGYGVDSTIITAASHSDEIVQQAMEITRKKGRVVVVGAVGLALKRSPFYQKEIDFLISCSYGPGRYDVTYEEKSLDYPYPYVRWTEQRNMAEYLRLLASGKVSLKSIMEKEYSITEAPKAYKELSTSPTKPIGVLLSYASDKRRHEDKTATKVQLTTRRTPSGKINVALIGAGSFASAVHLPNLAKLRDTYNIIAVADKIGNNARTIAEHYGASFSSTNAMDILSNKNVDMVLIATRHNLHARLAIDAAKAGKIVFVEKPMALNRPELNELCSVLRKTGVPFLVGFNRRFSSFVNKIQKITKNRLNPMIINYRMNAGYVPKDHWIQTEEGGGRNIGEACHIYDLFNFLVDSKVNSMVAESIVPHSDRYLTNDNFTAIATYDDGSSCSLTYTALGSKKYPKEKMDIYVDGNVITLDDYREVKVIDDKIWSLKNRNQDKGHLDELREFADSIRHGDGYPIPLWHLVQATEMSFQVEEMLRRKGGKLES